MVEVVLVMLETEAADRAGLIAVAKCKVEGSKRQASSRKMEVVASGRRIIMKETRGMAVTKKAMTGGNEKTDQRCPFL